PAPRCLQPGPLPGIDSPIVLPRQEKDSPLRRSAAIGSDHGAEQRPAAMLATTRISPAPAQAVAPLGRRGPASGHQRRADQSGRIAAPGLLRGANVAQT